MPKSRKPQGPSRMWEVYLADSPLLCHVEATTAGKARYEALLTLGDCLSDDVRIHHFRVVPGPVRDPYGWVRENYRVPAYMGDKVKTSTGPGTIAWPGGTCSQYVYVRLDGSEMARPYHPTDLTYAPRAT